MPKSLLDFRLLGPLSVTVDGVSVPVGGPRQMAVLARLMLTPDQVVTMDQLVESVWDGDEPAQPHVAIRSYVSNLRRAIEPNRRRRASNSCLASAPPGYRLAVDPSLVDWVRFDRWVEEGRRAVAAGDHTAAIDRLRRADELWKGDPCSGLPESQIFLGHSGRMTKLRETAVELLFEASLSRGDHAFVISEIEAAIAEHPLRERLTELAMMALYQAGRQSEALGLGRKLRARLLEELGIDPSPAIGKLELKILNHDPSLGEGSGSASGVTIDLTAPPPAPRLPAQAHTPTGVAANAAAVERDVDGLEPPSAPDRLRDATTRAADPWSALCLGGEHPPVGRDRELAVLARIGPALEAGRSMTVALTGDQGIGKTTLVCAALGQLSVEEVQTAWCRGMPGQTDELLPWSQLILGLLGTGECEEPLLSEPELAPLRALGPSVVAALGGRPSSGGESASGGEPAGGSEPIYESAGNAGLSGDQHLASGCRWADFLMAVTRLLERLARRGPLVLVFEDLQWADEATIKLINYAAATIDRSPVAFVLTWRETDVEVGVAASSLRELVRLPRMIRLELDGLDESAVSELATLAGQCRSPCQSERIQARSGGNPLFIKELLTHQQPEVTHGRRWSTLVDAVRDRIDQLDPVALPLLSAASLFRRSFTLGALAVACELDAAAVQSLLNLCVRGGILVDADPAVGSYRFRHTLIAEVLVSELLSAERAAKHQLIGHHLLATSGPGRDAAFHLSRSPEPADRVLAARLSLDRIHAEVDSRNLAELDEVISNGLTAAELLTADHEQAERLGLTIDGLHYRSWRAWLDGQPLEWLEHGSQALGLALEPFTDSSGKPPARGRGPSRPSVRSPLEGAEWKEHLERLQRCAMNLLGSPVLPTGPTRTVGFAEVPAPRLEELTAVVDGFNGDEPLKSVVQIHSGYSEARSKPGPNSRAKWVRDAQKAVVSAQRRLQPADSASVQMIMISRFGEAMEPGARLDALTELAAMRPELRTEIFRTWHAYPALLELGRTYDAERLVMQTHDVAVATGDPLMAAEARLLWVRHLLWTGQLQAAEEILDLAFTEWTALGLSEPVPLVRQRRAIRLLTGKPAGRGHGPDSHHQLMVERARTPELALRLSRIGDRKRATECLEVTLQMIGAEHISLSDQALIAMASRHLEHEKGSLSAYELLVNAGDKPIVRSDGSIIMGPASLYAGLAAAGAGLLDAARESMESARMALHRFGGSPASMNAVLRDVGHDASSNALPTNS